MKGFVRVWCHSPKKKEVRIIALNCGNEISKAPRALWIQSYFFKTSQAWKPESTIIFRQIHEKLNQVQAIYQIMLKFNTKNKSIFDAFLNDVSQIETFIQMTPLEFF